MLARAAQLIETLNARQAYNLMFGWPDFSGQSEAKQKSPIIFVFDLFKESSGSLDKAYPADTDTDG